MGCESASEVDLVGGRVRSFCNDFPGIPSNKFPNIISQKPEVCILQIVNGVTLIVLYGTCRMRDCESNYKNDPRILYLLSK
jgi:hypothetical protein